MAIALEYNRYSGIVVDGTKDVVKLVKSQFKDYKEIDEKFFIDELMDILYAVAHDSFAQGKRWIVDEMEYNREKKIGELW